MSATWFLSTLNNADRPIVLTQFFCELLRQVPTVPFILIARVKCHGGVKPAKVKEAVAVYIQVYMLNLTLDRGVYTK